MQIHASLIGHNIIAEGRDVARICYREFEEMATERYGKPPPRASTSRSPISNSPAVICAHVVVVFEIAEFDNSCSVAVEAVIGNGLVDAGDISSFIIVTKILYPEGVICELDWGTRSPVRHFIAEYRGFGTHAMRGDS